MLQVDGIIEFGGKVGRAGNQERLVSIEPQSIDLLLVQLDFVASQEAA